MIRKAIIVVLAVGLLATALTSLIGLFYPLGLTVLADENGLFFGLRAQDGVVLVVIQYMTSRPQEPDQVIFPTIGKSLAGEPFGLGCFLYKLEPVTWIKAINENRCGTEMSVHFEYDPSEPNGTFHGMHRTIAVALHFASAMLLAVPVSIAVLRGPLRRWRRRRRGLCIRCGYNLEGNVSGVCPECGNARTGDRLGP